MSTSATSTQVTAEAIRTPFHIVPISICAGLGLTGIAKFVVGSAIVAIGVIDDVEVL